MLGAPKYVHNLLFLECIRKEFSLTYFLNKSSYSFYVPNHGIIYRKNWFQQIKGFITPFIRRLPYSIIVLERKVNV